MMLGAAWPWGPRTSLLKPRKVTSIRQNYLWHSLLVHAAVLSLTVGVATRYCSIEQPGEHATTIVKSHSFDAKRQHLLNDGLHWSAPAAAFILFKPARVISAVLPAIFPIIRLHSEDCLYSRPPPSC